jgi:hypothetical protein
VLQRLLDTEPGQVLPPIMGEMRRLVPAIGRFVEPYLEAEGVADAAAKGEYVARLVVSMLGSPGRWDLDDEVQVAELVRTELVAGVRS